MYYDRSAYYHHFGIFDRGDPFRTADRQVSCVKVGGMFIALKGSGGEEELQGAKNAIKVLGGRVEKSVSYNLPCGDGRTLIVIRKISQTPTKYPRNRGQMTKKPL